MHLFLPFMFFGKLVVLDDAMKIAYIHEVMIPSGLDPRRWHPGPDKPPIETGLQNPRPEKLAINCHLQSPPSADSPTMKLKGHASKSIAAHPGRRTIRIDDSHPDVGLWRIHRQNQQAVKLHATPKQLRHQADWLAPPQIRLINHREPVTGPLHDGE